MTRRMSRKNPGATANPRMSTGTAKTIARPTSTRPRRRATTPWLLLLGARLRGQKGNPSSNRNRIRKNQGWKIPEEASVRSTTNSQ
jgi:hypothetical protein